MKRKTSWILWGLPITIVGLILINLALHTDRSSSGALTYETYCSRCHGEAGEGFRNLYPPLANADWVQLHVDRLPCVIRFGIGERIVVNGKAYKAAMLPVEGISDLELLNLCNYIMQDLNGMDIEWREADLKEMLDECY